MMALTQKHRKQLYDSLNYVKAAFLRILMLLKTFGSETERERERERVCVLACVLYYNTKLWTQFYISGLTYEQGWLRSVCASSRSDQTLLFSHII